MRLILTAALFAAALAASGVRADQPCPCGPDCPCVEAAPRFDAPPEDVPPRFRERLEKNEADIAGLKKDVGDIKAALSRIAGTPTAPAPKVVVPVPTVARSTVGDGHSHTCPRCGTSWTHDTNQTHNCPRCGTAQFVQDAAPRFPAVAAVAVAAPAPQYQPQPYLPQFSLPGSSGGCVGGQCGTSTASYRTYSTGTVRTSSGGWYPGRNLGR